MQRAQKVSSIHELLILFWMGWVQSDANESKSEKVRFTEEQLNKRMEGICHGIVMMGVRAALMGKDGELAAFDERNEKFHSFFTTWFQKASSSSWRSLSSANQLQTMMKFIEHIKESGMTQEVVDLLALSNGIALFFEPEKFPDFFESKVAETISVDDVHLISNLVTPKDHPRKLVKIPYILSANHNEDSIEKFLKYIIQAAEEKKLKENFAILESSFLHVIGLVYYPLKKEMAVIEPDHLPSKKYCVKNPVELKALVQLIKIAFSKNFRETGSVGLNTSFITTLLNEKSITEFVQSISHDLKQFSGKGVSDKGEQKLDVVGLISHFSQTGDKASLLRLFTQDFDSIKEIGIERLRKFSDLQINKVIKNLIIYAIEQPESDFNFFANLRMLDPKLQIEEKIFYRR